MAIPQPDNRDLNTLVTSTIDSVSTGMHNFIDDGRQKLLGKLAAAGRIMTCNDADRFKVRFAYEDDGESWTTYVGDEYDGDPGAGGAANNLGFTQNEILSESLYTLFNRTKNFNIPQKLTTAGRDEQVDVIAKLGERLAIGALDLEENYLLRGASTAGGAYASLAPYKGDTDYDATKAPMSLIGLLSQGLTIAGAQTSGSAGTDPFGYVEVTDHPEWAPQNSTATNAAPATDAELRTMLRDIDSAIRSATFGAMEGPTDILTTQAFYERVLQALMTFGRINDTLVRDMGQAPNEAIPLSGLRGGIDYHHRLTADAAWDFAGGGVGTHHPVLGLNLDSLSMRFVGQPSSMGRDAGWINQYSELLPHPVQTNYFKRLAYTFTAAVEGGRRSFFTIDGYTL